MKKSIFLFGALTSKPYAFKARSWELRSIDTIDLFDSLGSNIRVDVRGSEIMRILPINNEYINEEWISDKARYAYDGLNRDRFINPMIKQNGYFVETTWKNAISVLNKLNYTSDYKNFVINTGNFVDLETLSTISLFRGKISANYKVSINPEQVKNVDFQENYTINPNILSFEGKKVFLLVGINLRLENPVLNIRFKKLSNNNNVLIGYIGARYDYNINLIHLGNNLEILDNILLGKHQFSKIAYNFLKTNAYNNKISTKYRNKIAIIFGNDFIQANIDLSLRIKKINHITNLFEYGFLESYTGRINIFEVGFFNNIKIPRNEKKIFYLINTETLVNKTNNDFVIFQGHHNTKNRNDFDLILPSIVWTEKSSLFMNLFGFIQKTQFAVMPPVNCKNDWKISVMVMKSFCTKNTQKVGLNSKQYLSLIYTQLDKLSPNLTNSVGIYKNNIKNVLNINYSKTEISSLEDYYMPFKSHIFDYYKITSVEKASKIMNSCSLQFNKNKSNFLK